MRKTAQRSRLTALDNADEPVSTPFRVVRYRHTRRQHGAVGIMTAVLLPVIIGLLALAIESARIYNRKAEMHSLADAIALSAARQLDGTANGISNAVIAAHDVVEGGYELTRPHYQYQSTMVFSDSALKFSTSPDGSTEWLAAESAKASPGGIAYVKIDTDDLNPQYGTMDLWFKGLLGNKKELQISHTAVAGRRRLNVVPFAICAMSQDPSNPIDRRENLNGAAYSELREYGFRRGVGYNLLKLSPNTAMGQSYVIDPVSPSSNSAGSTLDVVGAYMCTGTVELPKVIGQSVKVLSSFTISQFANQLNSRFDASNGQCNAISAPPDSNIRQYPFGSIGWMTKPVVQVADPASSANRLQTIADLAPTADQTPTRYGPLWAFAMAVPWSSYTAGQSEPPAGYVPFQATTIVWQSLYRPGPGVSSYPTDAKTGAQSPPYFTQTTAPTVHPPGIKYRRVLNVPLLSCPVAGSPGTVVAIGKFFMTVVADANGVYGEFAGATSQEMVSGPVELIL